MWSGIHDLKSNIIFENYSLSLQKLTDSYNYVLFSKVTSYSMDLIVL